MSNDSKKTIILMGMLMSIFMIVGVSYAFFTYTKVGTKQSDIITGQIYMNYVEGQLAPTLTNMLPETNAQARARTDNVYTFTIEGVNTSTDRDIYYEIMLSKGQEVAGRTNRLNDNHLKFDLVEKTTDGTNTVENQVVSGASYSELNNTVIYVNTIPKNTTVKRTIEYELRMWISDGVRISDTDAHDYTTSVFNDSYASVIVSVHGDFATKTVTQPIA